jgi:DNA polymerase-3 subunit alpha
MSPFVHLHVHTEYSLLDGAAKISELFSYCKSMDMPAVAITDHGVLYGVIDFHRAAEGTGVKPITGCEFYVAANMYDKQTKGENDHLILLAKDVKGYKNLIKLDSLAFVDGFYYKPRIDLNLLEKYSEGLICLSACIAGGVPRLLLRDDYAGAKALALRYKGLFAEGDYYIELQNHGLKEQQYVNPLLKKLAAEIGVKCVATNDVHYLTKADAETQDVLMCVQMGKTFDEPGRLKFETDEFYLKSRDEMLTAFPGGEELLAASLEIADKCNMSIEYKMDLIPNYVPENGTAPGAFLRELTLAGLAERYGENYGAEIAERAEYELSVIDKMGFNEYYLIVWDFINYARTHGISVGPGRGSGVGSIVAYAIRITNVEPLRFALLFERFLNIERTSMPDFDIDFCFERRGEVIEYVIGKYGKDRVAQIVTFGTLAAKAAIKDVARVYRIPYSEVDKITKAIPFGKVNLKRMLGRAVGEDGKPDSAGAVPELVESYESDANIRRVIDMAIKLEGMPRNTSMHAAGVVICKYDISDYVPLQRNGPDVTTQFTMIDVEALGLLKMDFLGLRTLTDIKKALGYIAEQTGSIIDFDKMGFEDAGVYELIGEGDTDAVFQLEGGGMKRFMRELRPTAIEDIIAGISLYRPGPMESIPKYVKGKYAPDAVTYKHPSLKPFLEVTYGCIVYQEQVMQIVQALGGFSLGQADILRRAMGKKDLSKMQMQRSKFVDGVVVTNPDGTETVEIEGAVRRGVPREVAIDIFDEMEEFAKYAFNKSHAAAYAVLAYQTAYLKKYHRVEFIASVVNNRLTNIDEISKYVGYCRRCGIKILPPDVNRSKVAFSVEGGAIRFGLAGIKNCGEAAVNMITAERERGGAYTSFTDFMNRIDSTVVNKRLLESFIGGGVFDCFGVARAQLMSVYEAVADRAAAEKKRKASGQFSMFELLETGAARDEFPDVSEFPLKQKLTAEREVLGVYVTGHPLQQYKSLFDDTLYNSSAYSGGGEENAKELQSLNNTEVRAAGLLSGIRKIYTKAGKEMATARLEDLYGITELLFFSKSYQQNRQYLSDDTVVFIEGKLSVREEESPRILVDKLTPVSENAAEREQAPAGRRGKLYLRFPKTVQDDVNEILRSYPGACEVIAKVDGEAMRFDDVKINYCPALKSELLSLMTENDIVFKDTGGIE